VQTGDTVDSFYAQWGYRLDRQGHKPPKPYEQVRKGFRRGDLYVMNMGDYRLTFFDGELEKPETGAASNSMRTGVRHRSKNPSPGLVVGQYQGGKDRDYPPFPDFPSEGVQ